MLLHHALDILDDDDGVIDHDADGEHDRQQRDRIGRVAYGLERDERPDQADGYRQSRDQRRTYAPEENKHHEHHQDKRLEQRFFHLFDGCRDEAGRIVGDLPRQIFGEAVLRFDDPFSHLLQRGDRVGARRLINRHRCRRSAVQSRFTVKIGGTQFHPCDIAQAQHRSVRVRAHDDVLELGHGIQAALGLDVQLQLPLRSAIPRMTFRC